MELTQEWRNTQVCTFRSPGKEVLKYRCYIYISPQSKLLQQWCKIIGNSCVSSTPTLCTDSRRWALSCNLAISLTSYFSDLSIQTLGHMLAGEGAGSTIRRGDYRGINNERA